MKKISIIIINWENFNDTIECLNSLKKLIKPSNTIVEIILVDNGSKNESCIKIKEYLENYNYYHVFFIQEKQNKGFAYGNNVAIKYLTNNHSDFVWLLNNDTEVDQYALVELYKTFIEEKNVGIVGSRINYFFDKKTIWYISGRINSYLGISKHENLKHIPERSFTTDYVTGCSLFTSVEKINNVGLMDESYFLYYEETDWNIKFKNQKYNILVNPKSIVYHKVGSASGGMKNPNPILDYYDLRNSLFFAKKNFNKFKLLSVVCFNSLRIFTKFFKIINKRLDRKLIRFKLILKGYLEGILFILKKER